MNVDGKTQDPYVKNHLISFIQSQENETFIFNETNGTIKNFPQINPHSANVDKMVGSYQC
jgi:hypothetical protein